MHALCIHIVIEHSTLRAGYSWIIKKNIYWLLNMKWILYNFNKNTIKTVKNFLLNLLLFKLSDNSNRSLLSMKPEINIMLKIRFHIFSDNFFESFWILHLVNACSVKHKVTGGKYISIVCIISLWLTIKTMFLRITKFYGYFLSVKQHL